jgi:hypothetical protein
LTFNQTYGILIPEEIKMGQWKLEEGKTATVFDNYSKARDAYGKTFRRNEGLRKSTSAYDRAKYQTVRFRKIA